MATKKTKSVPKQLKLVCKCGSCTHWEIVLKLEIKDTQFIRCMSCGVDFDCYFHIGPHEGLHYERLAKNEK